MVLTELSKVAPKEMVPGYFARFVHSENMTLVYWDIVAGHVLPEHSHPHEQVVNVLEGIFELTIDGHSRVIEEGTVAVIPPRALHTGVGVTDCRILDVFYPVREDFKEL